VDGAREARALTGLMLAARACDLAALAGTVAWLADYTRSRWWRNPLSANLAAKTIIIIAFCAMTALSLFFSLNRLDSEVVSWCLVILLGSIGPVMAHRIWAFRRLGEARRCPEGHAVSVTARYCPECGRPVPRPAAREQKGG
jgi:protein-S-isoprenylcysteine O-methyltransferase Ste14